MKGGFRLWLFNLPSVPPHTLDGTKIDSLCFLGTAVKEEEKERKKKKKTFSPDTSFTGKNTHSSLV